MATEATTENTPEGTEEATPSKAGGKRTVLILAFAGLAAGTPAGLFGVAPFLAARRAAAPVAAKKSEIPSTSVTHAIENLVLNPAGSNGSRFLMVTATFELKDAGTEELMKDREPEVRDRILGVLGRKTVDELSDINKRDAIKAELLDAVAPLFPKNSLLKVFFPQFVIQ